MNPSQLEPFASLGLALAAGLVIGFEREQSSPRDTQRHTFQGGVRTYPLVALLGAVSMLLSETLGVWVVGAAFTSVVLFLLTSYADDVRRDRDRGMTSEVVFIVAFALGVLSLTDLFESLKAKASVVMAVSVVSAYLLSLKPELHAFMQRVSKEDVYSTLKLLVVAVVVLPLLPNEAMGPLDALNPREIGLLVVLIAAIGFAGYLLIRLFGARRGLILTGLAGGLVSSTAVTLSFSGRAKETPQVKAACTVAVVAASTIMFARVLGEVWIVNAALVAKLAVPVVLAFGAGIVASAIHYRRARHEQTKPDHEVSLSNPFELTHALKFAALFVVVMLGAKVATEYLGTSGTYLTGLLAGLTDVDAITLSMARMAKEGSIEPQVATTTILLGMLTNTAVKAGLAVTVGGWAFGRGVVLALGAALAAGAAGWIGVVVVG